MNLSIFLNIATVTTFIVYYVYTNRLIKKMLRGLQLGLKYKQDLDILTDQYRQLSNINAALRDIRNTKKK
jgi:hypothetical protein